MAWLSWTLPFPCQSLGRRLVGVSLQPRPCAAVSAEQGGCGAEEAAVPTLTSRPKGPLKQPGTWFPPTQTLDGGAAWPSGEVEGLLLHQG